jgi:hypothetical protein
MLDEGKDFSISEVKRRKQCYQQHLSTINHDEVKSRREIERNNFEVFHDV